jgi:hypothetical protein
MHQLADEQSVTQREDKHLLCAASFSVERAGQNGMSHLPRGLLPAAVGEGPASCKGSIHTTWPTSHDQHSHKVRMTQETGPVKLCYLNFILFTVLHLHSMINAHHSGQGGMFSCPEDDIANHHGDIEFTYNGINT